MYTRVQGVGKDKKENTVRIWSEENGREETWKCTKLVKERAEGRQHLRARGGEEGERQEEAETAVRFSAALKLSLPLGRSQFRCPRSASQVLSPHSRNCIRSKSVRFTGRRTPWRMSALFSGGVLSPPRFVYRSDDNDNELFLSM